jgi:hypothetical protein
VSYGLCTDVFEFGMCLEESLYYFLFKRQNLTTLVTEMKNLNVYYALDGLTLYFCTVILRIYAAYFPILNFIWNSVLGFPTV